HQGDRSSRRARGQGPDLLGRRAARQLGPVAPLELGPAGQIVGEPLPEAVAGGDVLRPPAGRQVGLRPAPRPQPPPHPPVPVVTAARIVGTLQLGSHDIKLTRLNARVEAWYRRGASTIDPSRASLE